MIRDLNVDQIKKLWILDLVIRNGSLRKAALQAKVSPSAISQSVSTLEHAIGKPLLVRQRGSVTATQDAVSLLDIVRPAFEAFDRLRDLRQAPAPKMTWLNFGTYESLAVDILPKLLHALKERIPHLKLGLKVSRTANLLTMVRKGELCSALISEVDDLDRFYVKEVAQDRLGIYVSRKHSIAQLGWRATAEYGIGSLFPGSSGLPRYYRRFLNQFELKPTILSDSFESLRAAAVAGAIVAVLPERVARRTEELLEISNRPNLGVHKILLVSQASCDTHEADFLATEVKECL